MDEVSETSNDPSARKRQQGESTHTCFAPANPTVQDPMWPQVLDQITRRLVSTAMGTHQNNNSPSLSPAIIESHNANASRRDHMESLQTSPTQRPNNRDTHNTEQTKLAVDRDELSRDHRLGDSEMPHGSTHGSTTEHSCSDKDQSPRHSEWQSLNPTALLAYNGIPPDEDIMPKRVADSERPKSTPLHTVLPNIPAHNDSQPATDHLANPNVTVAPKLTLTPSQTRLSDKHKGADHSPGASANPLANRDTTALAKQKTI